MPNIKSAKKRVLVSKANYEHNKAYRSALKTAVKKADAAIDANSADMAVRLPLRRSTRLLSRELFIRIMPRERNQRLSHATIKSRLNDSL